MQSKAIFITILSLCLFSTSRAQSLSTSCFSGEYYSRATGRCEQCDISCAQCTSGDGCSLCYDQMYLSPVGNKVLCGYCYEILAGCTVCSSAYKCARCSNGYFLVSNGTCANCSNITPNCALCYQNATSELYCSACNDPYILVDGACVANATVDQILQSRMAIIFGASTGSNSQASVALVSNRSTTQQTQQQTQQQTPQTQQAQQTLSSAPASSTQTITCDASFVQVGQVCTREIPFCNQYSTTTLRCEVCASSYSKSDQGYCIPDILLLTLQANTQNSQNSQYNQNVQNVQNNQISTSAQNSSNLPQSTTTSDSTSCPQGQYLWYGACVTPGTQCTSRDSNNKCTNCIKGYNLSNGLCIQQIPNSSPPAQGNNGNNMNNGATTGNGVSANVSYTVVTILGQTIEVMSSGCSLPCVTCKKGDPSYCVTCIPGMTIVDALPGVCYNQNR